MVKNFITTCLLVLGINTVALAADTQQETNPSLTTQQVQQQVIDEYKVIVAKIPPEVRDEIIAFRKNIVAINKQKRDAYQKLSQEAQSYLAKEQEYKKKLPIKQKPLINIQNPGEKPNKDSSTAK